MVSDEERARWDALRPWAVQLGLPLLAGAVLLALVVVLGGKARDWLRGQGAGHVAFADIDCPAPPGKTRGNKILWVSHSAVRPMSDLTIRAQRMVGARPVGPTVLRIVDGGPGPSTVDLPAAGCWRLALSWSGKSDTLDLRYQ